MSRIGKLPVAVPSGVEVTIEGQDVRVKGPKGELTHRVAEPITVARGEDGSLEVNRPDDERRSKAARLSWLQEGLLSPGRWRPHQPGLRLVRVTPGGIPRGGARTTDPGTLTGQKMAAARSNSNSPQP